MLVRLSGLGKSRYPLPYVILALILTVFTVLAGLARAARADQHNTMPPATERDVTYCSPGGVPLKMDIYMPDDMGSRPSLAALFVHGGSWASGDKASSEGAPETVELLRRGYLVASINYRLFPNYIFPAQIEDVKCAVRYLRANAATLNIDPDRIGAWGASAGGQLVSLLGTADETAGLEGNGGYEGVSSRVAAVVDMFGRADLSEVPQMRPDLLPVFGGVQELARYSPVTYVGPENPPFFILHGDRDTTVPPELSQQFYDRLRFAGVPATLVMVKNAGHGFIPMGGPMSPSRADITRLVGDFFDRYLKAYPPPNVPTPSVKAQTLPPGGDAMEVAATGKEVRGPFLDYWRSHGAIAQQGYPISAEMQEWNANGSRPYTVQYFERAVYEYHPENEAPYDVLASLLGAQRYRAKYPAGAPNQRTNIDKDSVYFEQTGHRLGGIFLRYWQEHGSIMQQGYPVSDEFVETNDLNGKPYLVQYFERAVFELHPENDEANRVLLSQLGTFRYRSKYVHRSPRPTATPSPNPAHTGTATAIPTTSATPTPRPTHVGKSTATPFPSPVPTANR